MGRDPIISGSQIRNMRPGLVLPSPGKGGGGGPGAGRCDRGGGTGGGERAVCPQQDRKWEVGEGNGGCIRPTDSWKRAE
jgi:hypothetical protein